MFTFAPTNLPDVILISPQIYGDDRGFFTETFRENEFFAAGINGPWVQDNHSGSRQGILRGLHYQIHHPQGKLVRAVAGEIFDVAVDIQRHSPTFGIWVGAFLSAQNKQQLWIPPGYAHGFYVISEWAEIVYKATDYYAPEWDRSILWNDPTIGIQWPLVKGLMPTLSSKDTKGKPLSEAEVFD